MVAATMLGLIRDAIKFRRQLTFDSTGHHRVACPHILGTKNGEWHLFVWQINNDSSKGFKPHEQRWRCIEVADISNIQAQDGEWHRGWTAGKGKLSCVDTIDTSVDPGYGAEIQSTFQTHTR